MTAKRRNAFNKFKHFLRSRLFVLVVIGLILVGLCSWYLLRNEPKDTNKPISKPGNSQQFMTEALVQTSTRAELPVTDQGDDKYLIVKEWGVKFKLPQSLQSDVKYGIFTENSGEQSAHFIIAEIEQLPESNCDLEEREYNGGSGILGGVASIHRKAVQYSPEMARRYKAEIRIDQYWYYVSSMRDACFTAPEDQFVRLNGEIERLSESMQKLVPQ